VETCVKKKTIKRWSELDTLTAVMNGWRFQQAGAHPIYLFPSPRAFYRRVARRALAGKLK